MLSGFDDEVRRNALGFGGGFGTVSDMGVIRENRWRSWRPSRRLSGMAAIVATGLAALWLVARPERASEATGWHELALRWAHSACWSLLAVAAATYALRGPRWVVGAAGVAGLAAYVAFLGALAV